MMKDFHAFQPDASIDSIHEIKPRELMVSNIIFYTILGVLLKFALKIFITVKLT